MQQTSQLTFDLSFAEAAVAPGPFVKWPGGKGGVLDQIVRHAPSEPVTRYAERPGSGAGCTRGLSNMPSWQNGRLA